MSQDCLVGHLHCNPQFYSYTKKTTLKFTFQIFSILVGEGASSFAKERGLKLVQNRTLISDRALKKYKKYKERLEISKKALQGGLKISIQPNPSQVILICLHIETYF